MIENIEKYGMFKLPYPKEIDKRRYELLDLSYEKDEPTAQGGICYFAGVPVNQLKELMEEGLLDRDISQGYSPTNEEFIAFMEQYPEEYFAHGYLVVNSRHDRRINIDGLDGIPANAISLENFRSFGKLADELIIKRKACYSWYD